MIPNLTSGSFLIPRKVVDTLNRCLEGVIIRLDQGEKTEVLLVGSESSLGTGSMSI